MTSKALVRMVLAGATVLAAAMPAVAQAPKLAMLDSLAHGEWELRYRKGDEPSRHICVHTGREFIRLRHHQGNCHNYVVQDEPDQVTVQYTCSGDGYGRTTIRRESSHLVQIESQGIQAGTPFSVRGEARYTGSC